MDLEITPRVLERFGVTQEALAAMVERPRNWVELAVLQVVDAQGLVAEWLPEALDFHKTVTQQVRDSPTLSYAKHTTYLTRCTMPTTAG